MSEGKAEAGSLIMEESNMGGYTLAVRGMTCDHCAQTVEKALAAVVGVTVAQVSYQDGTAKVESRGDVSESALTDAVKSKGYRAELLEARGRSGPGRAPSSSKAATALTCDVLTANSFAIIETCNSVIISLVLYKYDVNVKNVK